MQTAYIYVTDGFAQPLEEFQAGETRFLFERLGPEGPRRLVDGPMWAFVDWVMDDLSGLEMCRRLRADRRTQDAHVTMVLEHEDDGEKRRALAAGADDYMIGPLDRTAVLDRVLSVQGRYHNRNPLQMLIAGRLEIDMMALQARWDAKPVRLRPNEFRLLRFFAENPGRVLSRLDLIEGLGKLDPPIDERTVDVWIGRLRRALRAAGADNPLRTVRSLGYVLDID